MLEMSGAAPFPPPFANGAPAAAALGTLLGPPAAMEVPSAESVFLLTYTTATVNNPTPATTHGNRASNPARGAAVARDPTAFGSLERFTATPHALQNRAPFGSTFPQLPHAGPERDAPQLLQNFPLADSPQDGQADVELVDGVMALICLSQRLRVTRVRGIAPLVRLRSTFPHTYASCCTASRRAASPLSPAFET